MRLLLLALTLAAALPARASQYRLPIDADPIPTVYATLSAGALVPFNPLGSTLTPTLNVGYFLPAFEWRLAASLSLSYAQPSMTLTSTDVRLAKGAYESTLTTRDFRAGAGVQYHLKPAFEELSPYVGLRARAHFLSNRAVGSSAGGAFGDTYEQGTTFGAAPFVGLFYKLGPGVLSAELEVDLAPMDHLTTGDRNVSSLLLHVGYGFVSLE